MWRADFICRFFADLVVFARFPGQLVENPGQLADLSPPPRPEPRQLARFVTPSRTTGREWTGPGVGAVVSVPPRVGLVNWSRSDRIYGSTGRYRVSAGSTGWHVVYPPSSTGRNESFHLYTLINWSRVCLVFQSTRPFSSIGGGQLVKPPQRWAAGPRPTKVRAWASTGPG